jgi:hypothetical protein
LSSVASQLSLESVIEPGDMIAEFPRDNVEHAIVQVWFSTLFDSAQIFLQEAKSSHNSDLMKLKSDSLSFMKVAGAVIDEAGLEFVTTLKADGAAAAGTRRLKDAANQLMCKWQLELKRFEESYT